MRTKNTMQLKAYIRNKAREMDVPPQLVMQNYLLERLLERISHSSWRGRIVIKGACLFRLSSVLIGVAQRTWMLQCGDLRSRMIMPQERSGKLPP